MNSFEGFRTTNREFFARDVLEVAPALLGCILQYCDTEGTVAIQITEVEAYGGTCDPGSHSFRGKTHRNKSMFGPSGHVYCYFTYGLHHALNLVVGPTNEPHACLIRAGDVVLGATLARQRRERVPRKHPLHDSGLARGPGCVAQCFGANLTNDGDDLFGGAWQLLVPEKAGVVAHVSGPRVGVSGPGGNAATFAWRFWIDNHPSVSAYKAARA